MDTEPYLAGILAGIMAVAVVTAILTAVRKKQSLPSRNMTSGRWPPGGGLSLGVSDADAQPGRQHRGGGPSGPLAKPGVSAWMLIFLSIGVFIVACVRKDAYFAVPESPGPICGCSARWCCARSPTSSCSCAAGILVEDGLLTWNALSPACGVLFGVMFVCMLVRLRRQKREEQEDAEA